MPRAVVWAHAARDDSSRTALQAELLTPLRSSYEVAEIAQSMLHPAYQGSNLRIFVLTPRANVAVALLAVVKGEVVKGELGTQDEAEAKPREATSTCRVCRQPFLPSENHCSHCRFHPGRWMGAENAKHFGTHTGAPGITLFWDCCEGMTFDAPGCRVGRCYTYDE